MGYSYFGSEYHKWRKSTKCCCGLIFKISANYVKGSAWFPVFFPVENRKDGDEKWKDRLNTGYYSLGQTERKLLKGNATRYHISKLTLVCLCLRLCSLLIARWILINVTKHKVLSGKSIECGQWHRQDSGTQGQMISLVVNVAYMHHWAKPSQTVFRRSAIWRWPRAYSGRPLLHRIWCLLPYSNAATHKVESNVNGGYFCRADCCVYLWICWHITKTHQHSCPQSLPFMLFVVHKIVT